MDKLKGLCYHFYCNLKRRETYLYQWKPRNNGAVLYNTIACEQALRLGVWVCFGEVGVGEGKEQENCTCTLTDLYPVVQLMRETHCPGKREG